MFRRRETNFLTLLLPTPTLPSWDWPSQGSTFVAVSICFILGAIHILNLLTVLILTFCVSNLLSSVKVTELPPVWEGANNLACHLYVACLSF